MAKAKVSGSNKLWDGIDEADFLNEDFITEQDILDYNIPAMTVFIQNINIFRQLTMEKDGLKPIERRILWMAYEAGAYLKSKNDRKNSRKASKIVGDVMGIHGHSDGSIYGTLINNGQYWKNAVPLIEPHGNFANITTSDEYAHMRYNEALVSYYGYCCFFKDLDRDCLEMILSTTGGDRTEDDEPLALPSRYPNILVNGGFGMASGNLFCIPPFEINDIIKVTKQVLHHPELTSVYMVPDLPTGCNIVDTEDGIRSFCETGKGSLKMRATVDIEQKKNGDWILRIKDIPWMVNFQAITESLLKLTRNNVLQIKTIEDHSEQIKTKEGIRTVIDYWVIIDKSHDPYQFRNKLYKLTQLEKSLSIDFNIVTNNLQVDRPSLKELIQLWIDSRREYKRRLYNKELSKLNARISLLNILIRLTTGDNLEKTVRVFRTHTQSECIPALMKLQKMNSYQATQIYGMGFRAFHKNAHAEFIAELETKEKRLKDVMSIIHSEKKIDEIISDELDELKEWATPRKSRVIKEETDQMIADTDHMLIVTNQNLLKKLTYKPEVIGKPVTMGSFKQNDFPKLLLMKVNNMETVTFFDMYGKFSAIPVYNLESTISSNTGVPIYNVTKLNGPIINMITEFNPESIKFIEKKAKTKLSMVSLTAEGYIKKTPLEEFMGIRNMTNVIYTKVRENDFIVYTDILMDHTNIIVYTTKGSYSYIKASDIPSQTKQGTGLSCIKMNDMDKCVGLSAVGAKDTHLVIVTEKGIVKRVETQFIGEPGKRKVTSYLSTLEEGDHILWVGAMGPKDKTLAIVGRSEYTEIPLEEIPVQARKSKGKKMVSVPLGSNLIKIAVK